MFIGFQHRDHGGAATDLWNQLSASTEDGFTVVLTVSEAGDWQIALTGLEDAGGTEPAG